jgi:hypothetical protein
MTNQLTSTERDTTQRVRPPTRTITSSPTPSPTPTTSSQRPRTGRRWALIAGGAAAAIATALAISSLGGDSVEPGSRDIVEPTPAAVEPGSPDLVEPAPAVLEPGSPTVVKPAGADVVDLRPGYLIVQNEIDAAIAERNAAVDGSATDRSTAQIVQDQIDENLAEQQLGPAVDDQRPAYLIIQDEIDAALAERNEAGSGSADE